MKTCQECNKPLVAAQRFVCSTPCQKALQKRMARAERDALDKSQLAWTPSEALLRGDKYYYNGPCKAGHESVRYATTSKCCECQVAYNESRLHIVAKPPPVEVMESLRTAEAFLHILPTWEPVVVRL